MRELIVVPVNPINDARVELAKQGREPDRIPVDFSIANSLHFLRGWLGLSARDYVLNPVLQLEAQLAFRKRFRGLGWLGPNVGPGIEVPSALGCKVVFPDDDPAWVFPCVKTEGALADLLRNYQEPDLCFGGYLPLFYATYFYMYDKLGDQLPAPYGTMGPIDTACLLVGATNFFLWSKLYPEMIHDLLDKLTTLMIHVVEKRVEVIKRAMTEFIVFDDSVGNFSPAGFEEFALPYLSRIYKHFGTKTNFFHCDLTLRHLAEFIPAMGVNVLISFDPDTDIRFFKEMIGDRICLIGNVAPSLLLTGSPEQVRAECQRQMEMAGRGGRYVLSLGGELRCGTPPENIDALLDAADVPA